MKKNKYLQELDIPLTQKKKGADNRRKEVRKIQSWLCLQERIHPGMGTMTKIDGDFGSATEAAVKNFQNFIGETQNGIVTPNLFNKLTTPLKEAFEGVSQKESIRKTIIEVAQQHLKAHPFELEINNETNSGPWVRSYMDGNEGQWWFWCMGFTQAIIDQAFTLHNKNFQLMMPLTYSCDTVGVTGVKKEVLIRNNKIRENPNLVKPGDIMLLRKALLDWTHTAIIIRIEADTFTTIEGNTNAAGSRNGDGVYMRIRNFRTSKLDVFSIENWTD